jgi:hypothetical protein
MQTQVVKLRNACKGVVYEVRPPHVQADELLPLHLIGIHGLSVAPIVSRDGVFDRPARCRLLAVLEPVAEHLTLVRMAGNYLICQLGSSKASTGTSAEYAGLQNADVGNDDISRRNRATQMKWAASYDLSSNPR